MATITIGVINPAENEKVTMQVPNDVRVGALTEAMVEQMAFPLRERNGRRLRYHLSVRRENGRLQRLDEGMSLEQNNVQDNSILQLTVDMLPGELSSPNIPPNDPDKLVLLNDPHGPLQAAICELQQAQIQLASHLVQLETHVVKLDQVVQKQGEVFEEYKGFIQTLLQERTFEPSPTEPSEENNDHQPLPSIDYIDFDLTFSGSEDNYCAKALWLDGIKEVDATHNFKMPMTLGELDVEYLRNMGLTRSNDKRADSAQELGETLFETLFAEPIRNCFRTCQTKAEAANGGIRIRLDFKKTPPLINYPWEFLWSEEDDFLARSVYTPVVRYLPQKSSRPASMVEPPFKMLVVTASPDDPDWSELNIERERNDLTQALAGLVQNNLLQIEWLHHATPNKLLQALNHHLNNLHILHYIGHGNVSEESGGYLVLERNASGGATLMNTRRLSLLLRDCRKLKLVTLNSCRGARSTADDPFASVAMQLMRARIPAVVAMQHEISDRAAIRFSQVFYRHLATGRSVYTAMSAARKALSLVSDIEWATPVLYSCLPDGVIFNHAKADDS